MQSSFILVSIFFILLSGTTAHAQFPASDWPGWRGPNGNAKAPLQPGVAMPPLAFGEGKNMLWKSPVPGKGHSSPTILGNRIYLATAKTEPGEKGTQSVLCYARDTGKPIWKRDVHTGGLPPEIHKKNTHASSTIATDGKQLFVTFFNNGRTSLTALSLDGNIAWQKTIAPFRPKYPFGYAASPVIFKNLVIVSSESEAETAIVAFNTATGNEAWRAKRPQNSSYSSPAILTLNGTPTLVLSGQQQVRAYDPATGRDLWQADGAAKHTAGTITGEGNHLVASGGYPQSETVCVEVKDGIARPIWTNRQKMYEQSMLMHEGYVYAINDNGIAYCWRVSDGEEMWKNRLKGPMSASPILVGDRIYVSNERGKHWVFRASPKAFELLAENELGDHTFSTFRILDGNIYLRAAHGNGAERREFLYCFGK